MISVPLGIGLWLTGFYYVLCWKYLQFVIRIFQETPIFIVPRGKPIAEAEDVRFPTTDGLTLAGCYLRTEKPRKGVILFGLEFGSNRWSCAQYCTKLLEEGYDIFAFESRNQGDSDSLPGYEPLQWVTQFEVEDTQAAMEYLKKRPDVDPKGIGFFGISKGAGAGLYVAAQDTTIRCCVTDGAFATYTTLVPYMRHYFRIYNDQYRMQGLVPSWYYGLVGLAALKKIEVERQCKFVHLDKVIGKIAPRPFFMIHGQDDNYIKAEMALALFEKARQPKELWMVEGAKHNQALQLVTDEYQRRVVEFFNKNLAASTDDSKQVA